MKRKLDFKLFGKIIIELGIWSFQIILIYHLSGCGHRSAEMPESRIIGWILPSD